MKESALSSERAEDMSETHSAEVSLERSDFALREAD